MKKIYLIIIVFTLLLSGCGSSSSVNNEENGSLDSEDNKEQKNDNNSSSNNTILGKAIDGYIQSAIVTILNKETNVTIQTLKSDENGSFSFEKPEGIDIVVEISGGIDSSTGESFSGTIKNIMASDSSDKTINITPLTSLVVELVQNGSSITKAQNTIATSLEVSIDDLNSDPIETLKNGSDDEKLKASSLIKNILVVQKFSEVVSSVSIDSSATNSNTFLVIAQSLQNDSSLKMTEVMDSNNTDTLINSIKEKSDNELEQSKFEAIKELTENSLKILNEMNATKLATSNDVIAEITSNASSIETMLTPLRKSLTELQNATTSSEIIEQKVAAQKVVAAVIALGGIEGISNTLAEKSSDVSVADFAKSFLIDTLIDDKSDEYNDAIDKNKTVDEIIAENSDNNETVIILDFGSLKGSLYKETTNDSTRSGTELGLSNVTLFIKDSLGTKEIITDENGYFEISSLRIGDVNITIDMADPDLPENIEGTSKYTVAITKDIVNEFGDKAFTLNSDDKAIDPSVIATCENPMSFTWDGSTVNGSTKTVWENMLTNPETIIDINDTEYTVSLTLSDVNGQFNQDDSGTNNDKVQTYDDISAEGVISKGIFGSPYLSLYLGDDNNKNSNSLQKGDKVSLKVEFNKPVILDNWLFRDIDSGNTRNGESGWDWQDAVKITGYDKNNNVVNMSVTLSETTNLQNDNGIIRTKDSITTGSGTDTTDPKGHARWSSNGVSISYMIVEFSSGKAISDPTRSAIAASGFAFCPSVNTEAPTLTTTPIKTIENSVFVEVNGEAESTVFVNGSSVGTLNTEGKTTISLDTSGVSGNKVFEINLKSSNGIETKTLYVEVKKLGTGTITGNLYKETTGDATRNGSEQGLSNITVSANDGLSTQNSITDSNGDFTISGLASGDVTFSVDIHDTDIPEGGIVPNSTKTVTVSEDKTTDIGDISVFFETETNIDPSTLATCENPKSFTWDGSTVENSSQTAWTDMINNTVQTVNFGGYEITLTLDDVNGSFNNTDAGTSGIFGEPYLTLYMGDDTKSLTTGDKITLKVEFDTSIILDNWLFRDIDSGNTRDGESSWDWQDAVKVSGYDKNNNEVNMSVTLSQTTNLANINGTISTGDNNLSGSGIDTTDAKGHAKWSSNGKSIKYMIVEFSSGNAVSNPTRSAIAASGFAFCPTVATTAPTITATPSVTVLDTTSIELNGKENSLIYVNGVLIDTIIDENGKAIVVLDTSGETGTKSFTIEIEHDGIKSDTLEFSIEKEKASEVVKPILESLVKVLTNNIPNGTVVGQINVLSGDDINSFTLDDMSNFNIDSKGIITASGDLLFDVSDVYTTKVFADNGEESDKVSITFTFKEYLLDTTWNQGGYYKKMMPYIGEKQPPVGCVQVTLAQIMQHNYKTSTQGNGVINYDTPIKDSTDIAPIKAVLNRTYNWPIMPDKLNASTPTYQVDEVSYLFRDLIAVNKATISTGGTSASQQIDTIAKHFDYSTTMSRISDKSDDISREEVLSVIESQILNGNPVEIAMNGINGEGHSFIADGYKVENNTIMVHLNLGWGGSKNGWYDFESTEPLFGNEEGEYDLSREVIRVVYNMKPCTGDDCYSDVTLENGIDSFDEANVILSGTLHGEEDRDVDIFELYLKDNIILDVVNNGFFLELFDENMTLIEGGNKFDLNETLAPSKYFIRISTQKSTGSYYTNNYKEYSYDLNTTLLSDSEIASYKDALQKNVIIDMNVSDMIIKNETTKVYIYAYDENDEDNITFSADSSNSEIDVSFENNILVINPKSTDQASDITVTVTSTDGTSDSQTFKLLVTDNTMTGSDYSITGEFASKIETDVYEIPLKGECTINLVREGMTKTSPYSFLQLEDANGNIERESSNKNITSTSEQNIDGLYTLSVGLKKLSGGSAYGYTAGSSKNNYTISVSCPIVANDIISISEGLEIKPTNW